MVAQGYIEARLSWSVSANLRYWCSVRQSAKTMTTSPSLIHFSLPQIFRQFGSRAGREAGARKIAVPDAARDLPAAVRLAPPDPDALAFVVNRPAAALIETSFNVKSVWLIIGNFIGNCWLCR